MITRKNGKVTYTNKKVRNITNALLRGSYISLIDYDAIYELIRGFTNYEKSINPSRNKPYENDGRYKWGTIGKLKGIKLNAGEKRINY